MALNKFIMAVVFLVLTATAASAYTLVMRNGRRIEIPNEFTISGSTLTFEAGTGIQMTFQLSGIDIAATERANGEQSGSFLARASAPANVSAQPLQTQPRAQRSITNRDLEGYRRTRIESEIAYEKRRKELGLPSVQEARTQAAAIAERTREQLLGIRADNESSEEYWRGRANSLRSEMAVAQAQIEYVRARLGEIPVTNSFGTVFTDSPFGFPGLNQYPLNMGQRRFPGRYNRYRGRGRYNNVFGGNLVGAPFQTFDYSDERAELVNRLNDLQMNQAGLSVRWRELEDEARRAGAYPGWLRP